MVIKKATMVVEATTKEEAKIMHEALIEIYLSGLAKKGIQLTEERIKRANEAVKGTIEEKNGLYIGTVTANFDEKDEHLFKEGIESGKKNTME